MQGSAKTIIKEVDLSQVLPSFPGVFGGIVIPGAYRGPLEATFVTPNTFLKTYTLDEKPRVGDSLAYFTALNFLAQSNGLWVVRAAVSPLYGSVFVNKAGSTTKTTAASLAYADPETEVTFNTDGLFSVYASDPGEWNNRLSIRVLDTADTSGAFTLEVYIDTETVPRESFEVSRQHIKDGFGKNIYIEDRVLASSYIRVVDNVVLADTVLPEYSLITEAVSPLTLGNNGAAVTDGAVMLAWDKLANRYAHPLKVMMDAGWATPAVQKHIDALCSARHDCIGILSIPYDIENVSDYINSVMTYVNTTLNLNSSFSGIFTPWLKIYDKYNDRELWIDPTGFVGALIAYTNLNYEIWYPIGGYNRGALKTVIDALHRYDEGEMDLLYGNTLGINPVRFFSGKGIHLWGQKTLSYPPSKLNRINTRLLLSDIEPAAKDAYESFLFDINDAGTRFRARALMESRLEQIKAKRGLYDFLVVVDESNNSNADIDDHVLNIDIFLDISVSIEQIPLRFVITRTGGIQLAQTALAGG